MNIYFSPTLITRLGLLATLLEESGQRTAAEMTREALQALFSVEAEKLQRQAIQAPEKTSTVGNES